MKISIIACKASNGVIGKNGKLPWHISEDLKFFKEITSGHSVIMGYRTWESLPVKPLKNRKNFVICREGTVLPDNPDVEAVIDLTEFFKRTDINEVFVIGGESVYRKFIDFADEIYLTEIEEPVDGDTYFPEFDETKYAKTILGSGYDSKENLTYKFCKYVKLSCIIDMLSKN